MTIKEFIEKAMEGGWKIKNLVINGNTYHLDTYSSEPPLNISNVLLDPLAWQAVGKVGSFGSSDWQKEMEYRDRMHLFVDALCDGKDLEEALNEATV